MTDPTIASGHLELIAALITRALDALDADTSAPAIHCHSQAAAALQAINSVDLDLRTHQVAKAIAANTGAVDSAEPGALLAAAEAELIGLPPQLRNQVAVCAAAAYLRRARRALATQ